MKEMTDYYKNCHVTFNFDNNLIETDFVTDYDIDEDLEIDTTVNLSLRFDCAALYQYFKNDATCTLFIDFEGVNVLDGETPVAVRRVFSDMKIVEYRNTNFNDTFEVQLRLTKVVA